MSTTLTIEAKVLGQKKPLFPTWVIALPPDPVTSASGENRMRLRDLITKSSWKKSAPFNSAKRRAAWRAS